MSRRARFFIAAVAPMFLLIPFGARADENPIGILLAPGDIVTCPGSGKKVDNAKTGKATADLVKAEIATAENSKIPVRVFIPTQTAKASMVVIRDVKKDDCNRS